MPLQITITDAGRAEVINATNTGTGPVAIAEIGLGTGQYEPAPEQTALTAETKRLATIAGQVVSADTIHVTIKDETGDAYTVNEIGLFTDSGTLFAVYSDPVNPIAQKAGASALLLAVDIVLGTLDANSLTFGDTSFSNPPASETVAGVVALASNAETQAGTDNARAITPAGLQSRVTQSISDIQTGRFLKVGDLSIAGYSDNTYGSADNYGLPGRPIWLNSTASGKPTGVGAGILIPLPAVNANTQAQYFIEAGSTGSPDIFFRQKNASSGAWNDWVELHHTGNLAKADITTALAGANDTDYMTPARVQERLGNLADVISYSSAGTISAADAGKLIRLGGAGVTHTLPSAAAVRVGSVFTIQHTGTAGNMIIQTSGSDVIDSGATSAASIQIGLGETAIITALGSATWNCFIVPSVDSSFASSLSGNGWQKLPSGMIIQWGTVSVGAVSTATVTLPVTFPVGGVFATATRIAGSPVNAQDVVASVEFSGATSLKISRPNSSALTVQMFWVAIGY